MQKFLVAVDDGYAQTKVYGVDPNDSSKRVRTVYRTSARPGRYMLANISGDSMVSCYRAEEGDEFTVSDEIVTESTVFDGFHESTMNRVITRHGLALAGYGGSHVDLTVGLPVADYFEPDGNRNKGKISRKIANMLKGVERISPGAPLAVIDSVDIGCQAFAALFDYALDDDLKPRAGIDIRGKIAVVDIGGRTTDIAVVMGGSQIDHVASGTKNLGVLDVYKLLESAIQKKFGTRDSIPYKDLDATVRTGVIHLWGQENDVKDLVVGAVREIENQVGREIERRLGSAAMMNAVVFVGGGAALFNGVAHKLRNGVMLDDPEFANARGLWKFAGVMARKTAAATA